jgi:ribonuclease J
MNYGSLGVLPELRHILNTSAVYISHLHLDHLGSLDHLDIVNYESSEKFKVFLPRKEYFLSLLDTLRYSWKSVLLPHSRTSLDRVSDIESSGKEASQVVPVKAFHSAYPSYSIIVTTDYGEILYTGDFRLESIIKSLQNRISTPLVNEVIELLYGSSNYDPLIEVTNYIDKLDAVVIEGTNFGRSIVPLSGEHFVSVMEHIIGGHPTIVSLHHLDIESIIAILIISQLHGKQTIVYSKRIAKFLDYVLDEKILREVNESHTDKKPLPTLSLSYVPLDLAVKELLREESIIITDFESIDIARALMRKEPLGKTIVALLISSEPTNEEYSIEQRRRLEWFRRAKIQPYRVRVSGHYYPHQFTRIIESLKLNHIIPIHTNYPSYILRAINKN